MEDEHDEMDEKNEEDQVEEEESDENKKASEVLFENEADNKTSKQDDKWTEKKSTAYFAFG